MGQLGWKWEQLGWNGRDAVPDGGYYGGLAPGDPLAAG